MKELFVGRAVQIWEEDSLIHVNFISRKVIVKFSPKEWNMIKTDFQDMTIVDLRTRLVSHSEDLEKEIENIKKGD